jgi:tRNA(Ser,Leu) C12 N-acetylase TAN1
LKDWNVVVTSYMRQERRLLAELSDLGEFHSSGFAAVILGKVPDVSKLFETLKGRLAKNPVLPDLLSSVTPVRRVFAFTLENLEERLRQEIRALAPEIGGQAFYVRLKRRGHKGELHSVEVEQALDRLIKDEFCAQGQNCFVDFHRAEVIVVVETVHNQCGVGLVTREMKERYPFIKIE